MKGGQSLVVHWPESRGDMQLHTRQLLLAAALAVTAVKAYVDEDHEAVIIEGLVIYTYIIFSIQYSVLS